MIKIIITVFCIIFSFVFIEEAIAAEFDELDKPPEGAHEGQMFLGAFFSFGWPRGSSIDAENDFVNGSYYTFSNDITKSLEVTHQSYAIGLAFEYMPVRNLGVAARLRRTYIMQNTKFGTDYENWKGYLYRDVSFYAGPALHATTRKSWDFVLTPLMGYAIAKYNATPVAKKIVKDPDTGENYSGDTGRESKHFSFGAELNCVIYFTGGLYISLGGEWIRNTLKMDSEFNLTNPQTERTYTGKAKETLDTYSILISAGYAFSN